MPEARLLPRPSRRHFIASSLALGAAGVAPPTWAQDGEAYLFAYFTRNGEDGLHLARSTDGLDWRPTAAGRSWLAPTIGSRLMRDPSITRGHDGRYHLVWTTGWWDQGIGLAHSDDLRRWTPQIFLPVMADVPGTLNCWAPEIFFDADTATYVIVWASTVPGRFTETALSGNVHNGQRLNHRLYAVTTRDFATYTPTRLFYDPGFNVIDGVLARLGPRDYVLVVKDETQEPRPRKHLRVARGLTATGPFEGASAPFTADWVEGPSVLRVGAEWLIYFDEYTRKRYGAVRTRDFAAFTPASAALRCPAGMRHGTAFAVSRALADGLDR